VSDYRDLSLQDKAKFLVERKGEMSVELWNDRAQCVLAPMLQEITRLKDRNEKLERVREAAESLSLICQNPERPLCRMCHACDICKLVDAIIACEVGDE